MTNKKNRKVCVFTIHRTKDLRIFNRQCRSLQKHGWSVTLIGISENGNYEDEGINVIGIKRWNNILQRIKTLLIITYKAYKLRADIYHFHDPDLLIPASFLRLFTLKPVIYDVHELYSKNLPLRLPNIWLLRKIASFFIWLIETITARLCGYISHVSEDHIKRFAKLGCRTVWTPNFASLDDFVPTPVSDEEWKNRHKKVIFIGTLSPDKGSLILLDIAKQIKKQRPDIEVLVSRRFLAPFQEKVMLEKMTLPAYSNVIRFIPNVNGTELPKVVRQAGVGLSPIQGVGQYRDAVPTKFFEYMSQAVPIVASDLPPSHKYVKDEGCGIIVTPDVPDEYAEAIIKIVDNQELAKEMGRKGQQGFIKKYNWNICERRLIEFYESVSKE